MKTETTRRTRQGFRALLLFSLIIAVAGCGYRFSPGGEWLDSGIKTVFVDNITNTTSEPSVEVYLRNGFEDQFRKSTRLKLASSRETADAILTGTIRALSAANVSFDRFDKATESRAFMTVDLVFEEKGTRKRLWSVSNFSGNETFRVDQANPYASSVNKTQALQKLSSDLAEKAYRNLMSGF